MRNFRDIFKGHDLKDIVIVILLLVGLILGVYSVQNPQIFQSQAESNLTNAFNIKDTNGNQINCTNNVCTTRSLEVEVQLKDLSPLLNP